MARCPFATWRPITGSSGPHLGGPFKIVHHTTEGSSASGAMSTFAKKRSDPHFTVDGTTIYQHVDTEEGARALRNDPGGVQTNRDSAVQIELVGFAHLPKDRRALTNIARLCRWIEQTHGVPRVWPAGLPRVAKNGNDPGGHNRDPLVWDGQSGHYGHCHVPENLHWDPGYTAEEVSFLMDATFDSDGNLLAPEVPPVAPQAVAASARRKGVAAVPQSTMPDHDVVPIGISAYLRDLPLTTILPAAEDTEGLKRKHSVKAARRALSSAASRASAKVNAGSLVCFCDGISQQDQADVLYSVQFAQRGASGYHDRFTETRAWYQKYTEILENLGWITDQFAFSHFEQAESDFQMDKAALAVITAIATQGQLGVLLQAVSALSGLAKDDGAISVFDYHASLEGSGNFQLGAVQRTPAGALTMALGAFYFRAADKRERFLFFKWGAQQINFWTAAQRMTLNTAFFHRYRGDVVKKLGEEAPRYIVDLKLGAR